MTNAPSPQYSSGRDALRQALAERIETNPLGWLPVIGDCINITFTPDEAKLLTAALRSSSAPQIAGVRDGWKLVPERPTHRQMDAGLYQSSADSTYGDVWSIYADMIDTAPSLDDHSDQTTQVNKDATTRAISPQAQAGETNTDAEPSRCKNPVARGESMETDALTGDAPVASVSTLHAVAQASIDRGELLRGLAEFFSESVHHVWSNGEIALYLADMAAEASASPPAALPAGEAEGIQWRRVNDEPYEYAVQQGPHGDEFVKLLNGSCLCRTLVTPSTEGK